MVYCNQIGVSFLAPTLKCVSTAIGPRTVKRERGFTLIELLFVIAIIGVVLALLSPALMAVKRRAQAIQCTSRLHQLYVALQAYMNSNDEIIPFVVIGPEASSHPQQLFELETGVPSLKHLLEGEGEQAESARCVADTGCPGQSLYPTEPGVSCFEDWGQSMLYNSSCYRDEDAPGQAAFDGPLFGAVPVRLSSVTRHDSYLLASDFWAHWHFGASTSSLGQYYTNVLYFDGHVVGMHYLTSEEALAYLNWDGVRRWWVKDPGPSPLK
jgi:prepilin-type N-terminal cleavage/methylation domain-containing protein/prepilin-type processing-associated H-X9-DG protein